MSDQAKPSYVELPGGIFTAEGVWYHTTEMDISEYVPDLVDHYGLNELLTRAGAWGRLPVTASIISLAPFLLVLGPWEAALASLSVYLFLAVVSPSVVIFSLIPLVRRLNHPIFQGLLYVLLMSYLASMDQFVPLTVGLTGFVLFRWQIISRLFSRVVGFLSSPLSSLDTPDTILRNVLVRGSMKHGFSVGKIDQMEKRIAEIMTYSKTRSKKKDKDTN